MSTQISVSSSMVSSTVPENPSHNAILTTTTTTNIPPTTVTEQISQPLLNPSSSSSSSSSSTSVSRRSSQQQPVSIPVTVTPASIQIGHLTNMVSLLTDQLSQFEHQLHEAVEETLEWKNSSEEWEQKFYNQQLSYRNHTETMMRNHQEQIDTLHQQMDTYEQRLRTVVDDNKQLQSRYNESLERNLELEKRNTEMNNVLTLLQKKLDEITVHNETTVQRTTVPSTTTNNRTENSINDDAIIQENLALKEEIEKLRQEISTIKNMQSDTDTRRSRTNHPIDTPKVKESTALSPVNSSVPEAKSPSSPSSSLFRISATKLRVKKQVSTVRLLSSDTTTNKSPTTADKNNYSDNLRSTSTHTNNDNADNDMNNSPNKVLPSLLLSNNNDNNNNNNNSSSSSVMNSPIDSVGFFTPTGSPSAIMEEDINNGNNDNDAMEFTGGIQNTNPYSEKITNSYSFIIPISLSSSSSSTTSVPLIDEQAHTEKVVKEGTFSNSKISNGHSSTEEAMIQAELAASAFLLQRDAELIEHMRNSILFETTRYSSSSSLENTKTHNILAIVQNTLDELSIGRVHMGLTTVPSGSVLLPPTATTVVPSVALPSSSSITTVSSKVPVISVSIVDKELHDTLLSNTMNATNKKTPYSLSSSPLSAKSVASVLSTTPLSSPPNVPIGLTPLEKVRQSRQQLDNRWDAIMGSYRSLQSSSSSLASSSSNAPSYRPTTITSNSKLLLSSSSSVNNNPPSSVTTCKSTFISALSALATSNARVPPLPVNPVTILNNVASNTTTSISSTTTSFIDRWVPPPHSTITSSSSSIRSRPVEHAAALSKQVGKVVSDMEQWKLDRQLKHTNPYTVLHPPPVPSISK